MTIRATARPTVKVVVATTVMLSFISFWRAAAIVLSDLASTAYYVGGIAEGGHRQIRALVHPGDHAVLVRGARHLHRKLLDVRARRRVQGGARGHGRHAGQVLGLRPDVRLRADRPHQRRQRRPVPGRPDQRDSASTCTSPACTSIRRTSPRRFAAVVTLYFWRKNIIGMHESSEKALRIMQITTVMVVILIVWCLVTILKNGYQPVPLPLPRKSAIQPGRAGLAEGHGRAVDHGHRHPDRAGPLAARHERRGEPGAGEPRDRASQAEEPGARRLRDLHLQHAVHVAGLVLRGDDHSRRGRGRSFWTT